MVRTGDHARRQSLGHPRVQYEETDFGVNFEQIASTNVTEFPGIHRVQPERILVRDLVKKFGIPRSRVNQMRQTENRQQGVHLALGILWPLDEWHVSFVELFRGFSDRRGLR